MSLNDMGATRVAERDKSSLRASNGVLDESQLSALEWARDFMRNYEKKLAKR